ncbi:hypothetical protein KIPB_001193 [Kipferlia bialata]|uniref:Uncharacterized protein n=1 Tax=Kipferlia bialata TaxID=797122 RepID=A0A9K3GDZ5_9EUKA|nr:hypothetical protein KIPB_001193 [Kipferlia bialata]|eukprot:g1193.t1
MTEEFRDKHDNGEVGQASRKTGKRSLAWSEIAGKEEVEYYLGNAMYTNPAWYQQGQVVSRGKRGHRRLTEEELKPIRSVSMNEIQRAEAELRAKALTGGFASLRSSDGKDVALNEQPKPYQPPEDVREALGADLDNLRGLGFDADDVKPGGREVRRVGAIDFAKGETQFEGGEEFMLNGCIREGNTKGVKVASGGSSRASGRDRGSAAKVEGVDGGVSKRRHRHRRHRSSHRGEDRERERGSDRSSRHRERRSRHRDISPPTERDRRSRDTGIEGERERRSAPYPHSRSPRSPPRESGYRRDRSPDRRDRSPYRRDRSPDRRDRSPDRRDRSPDRRDSYRSRR